mmetsp:Transcript_8228/g.9431  ORF Transcript_8228/g.9431 Transcript_8228/m.9431 type:complete len:363 (-) Transcript_8228:95-1183(-)
MSNISAECDSDQDCILGLICFFDDDANTEICGCSGYYGWEGEECTEIGPKSTVYVISSCLQIVIAFYGLVLCSQDILFIIRHKIKIRVSPKYFSWGYATSGLILIIVWKANEIRSALTPEKNTNLSDTDSNKRHEYVIVSRILTAIVFVFLVNGLLQVALLWMEVAYKTERFILGNQRVLNRAKAFVYGNQFIVSTVIIFFAARGRFDLVSYFLGPYNLLITIFYSIGAVRFRGLFKKFMDNEQTTLSMTAEYIEKHRKLLNDVRRSSIYVSLCMCAIVTFGIIYGIQDVYLDNFHLGNFPIGMLAAEGTVYSLLFLGLSLSWYTRQLILYEIVRTKTPDVITTSSKDLINNSTSANLASSL